jgi:hypothetical protein
MDGIPINIHSNKRSNEMRRSMTLLGTLAMMLALSGSANAGYWSVTYDLTGSVATTTSQAAVLTDTVVGKWRFEYDSVSEAAPAPYSGARVVAGSMFGRISQSAAPLLITGDTYNTLLPGAGGVGAGFSGATLSVSPTDDARTRGFITCWGSDSFCTSLFGANSGVKVPQTPTGPGPFPFAIPNVKFGATVGVGGFTTDPKTDVVNFSHTGGSGTNPLTFVSTVYKGAEVSRYYITGAVPALSGGALAGLAAFLLLGGTSTLALRNRRS